MNPWGNLPATTHDPSTILVSPLVLRGSLSPESQESQLKEPLPRLQLDRLTTTVEERDRKLTSKPWVYQGEARKYSFAGERGPNVEDADQIASELDPLHCRNEPMF